MVIPRLNRDSGIDAGQIYSATVGQRAHILQQLEEAERNAQDALFALEMMEIELARKSTAMESTLSHLSETLSPHEFKEMCAFALGQSKKDWEKAWKHEWVEDGTDGNKLTRPGGPSKSRARYPPPAHHRPSSPLPPSSPPPPTSPLNQQGHFSSRISPVRTKGVPVNESELPTRPGPSPTLDGFRAPREFVDNFGSTRYQPTAPASVAGSSRPQQSRQLKRDLRRLEVDPNGELVLIDPTDEIEAHRRYVQDRKRLQAQPKFSARAQTSLSKIVRQEKVYDHNNVQDRPLTWSRVFEGKKPGPDDLRNPFSQGSHVPPPAYPDLDPHPEWDGDKHESDSETNPHVPGDQR